VALFEYMLQVPANRIGCAALTLPQLKSFQEAISLAVSAPFAIVYMTQPIKSEYLWACLCAMGALTSMFWAQS
jgi:uncharacterized protein